ncbi:hypothetical protein HAX54_013077 [Datura stramonium]|uniref:Uncharacterized protein n=1 Tax=Datura stramonium TaxID=4076 RepID=A0ABS8RYM2_DATST|nr:hypothetical protein [Datura stramonium]
MRQEKELLRMLSHSYYDDQYHHPSITMQMHNNNIHHHHHHHQPLDNNNKLFSPQNPESSSQLSLSLWPEIHPRTLDKSRVVNNTTSLTKNKVDGSVHSDVDTSLHL